MSYWLLSQFFFAAIVSKYDVMRECFFLYLPAWGITSHLEHSPSKSSVTLHGDSFTLNRLLYFNLRWLHTVSWKVENTCFRQNLVHWYLACGAHSPRVEMRACNNHGGKSINAHLNNTHIIYKPNQSYSFERLEENPVIQSAIHKCKHCAIYFNMATIYIFWKLNWIATSTSKCNSGFLSVHKLKTCTIIWIRRKAKD